MALTSLGIVPVILFGAGTGQLVQARTPWLLAVSFGLFATIAAGTTLFRRRLFLRGTTQVTAGPETLYFSTPSDHEIGLSVVVPTFNEALRLPDYLREIVTYLRGRGEPFEVVVADDGSTDNTVQVVNELSSSMPEVRIVANPRNFGKGFAVRTGIANSYGKRVLFVDADGSTPIAELERLEAAMRDGASIAIGSRAIDGPGISRSTKSHRKIIGRVFHGIVSTLLLPGLKDTQCGFKLFTRAAASATFGRQNLDGFSFDVELLFIGRRLGYRIDEVAVSWSDAPGSKVNLVSDAMRMLVDIFHIVARDLGDRHKPTSEIGSVAFRVDESELVSPGQKLKK